MALPTKKIPQLTAGIALTGAELLEAVQGGQSVQLEARDFVLPTDSLLTMAGQGGAIPGSRRLVSSLSVAVNDGGPGGQVSLTAISAVGAPTGLQTFVAAAGNNNNVVITSVAISFFDVNTAAGIAALTGLLALFDGQIITITNIGANLLTLTALSGLSLAANQFRLPANIGLVTNSSYTLRYSSTIGKWVPYS